MLFALIFALSLDSLLVGITYSLRRIKIPLAAYFAVGLSTLLLMGLSMIAGEYLSAFVSPQQAGTIGGYLLLGLGLWQLSEGWQQMLSQSNKTELATIRLKALGLVVQILRDPVAVDLNSSGAIELKESLLLGLALGLDAFAAGFALALTGMTLWAVPLTAVLAMAMLALGASLGARLERLGLNRWGWAAPGLVLIILGLLEL